MFIGYPYKICRFRVFELQYIQQNSRQNMKYNSPKNMLSLLNANIILYIQLVSRFIIII